MEKKMDNEMETVGIYIYIRIILRPPLQSLGGLGGLGV